MKDAKTLLELCRQRFPLTRAYQSHALTIKDGTMVLTLMLGDTMQSFNLDDDDLKRPPSDLLRDVERLFERPHAVNDDIA